MITELDAERAGGRAHPTTDAQRAAAWRLIAHLYRREVDQDLARRVLTAGLLDVMALTGLPVPDGCMASPEALGALRVEYTRVFIGPGAHAVPYGSVHHPDDPRRGQLWGSTTQWFRRFAMDHGVTLEGEAYDGIPDHVSHELELYSQLLWARVQAREAEDAARLGRLDHSISLLYHRQLVRWIPIFLDRVDAVARPGSFYFQLAGLTRALLEAEGELVEPAGEEISP